jgi:alcohol dehydrogenase (cytochrome c)
LTGTYDSATNIVYWGIGNPCRNFNGDDRQGDNLYTSSVVALNASTGALQWYFQFTPHNLWDYDGANTPMLIDTTWQGQPRSLLFQANRNGYFYVLDRGTGQYLSSFPFVTNLNWSSGLDPNGRPIVNSAAIPTTTGATVCPSVVGATNWMSSAYSPQTGLFYLHALEQCDVVVKGKLQQWQAGQLFEGGYSYTAQGAWGMHLRALNPATNAIAWDTAEGLPSSNGGVLATAGGLVFAAQSGGSFSAFDASVGTQLWTYAPGNKVWKASPMTYELNGKQFVAIANPGGVLVFGL